MFLQNLLFFIGRALSSTSADRNNGSHGIEPTRDGTQFPNLDSWSLGAFYAFKKHFTQFLKMGSSPCWVQFHAFQK